MNIKLKPCPFCGGDAGMCCSLDSCDSMTGQLFVWARCRKCDAKTKPINAGIRHDTGKSFQSVLDAIDGAVCLWNLRTQEET